MGHSWTFSEIDFQTYDVKKLFVSSSVKRTYLDIGMYVSPCLDSRY